MDNEVSEARRSPRRSTRTQQQLRTQVRSGDLRPRRSRHIRDQGNGNVTGGSSTHVNASPDTHSSREDGGTNVEDVSEDDICPICQLLYYRPVTTICNHTLCESCMATWADVSVTSQMQIVDIDEPPTEFNPVSGLEAKCPMCRTLTSATLDTSRTEALKQNYPHAYAQRESEHTTAALSSNSGEIQTLTLSIGNSHRLLHPRADNNVHDWTFFVRPSRTDIIEEVHILLHPTFRPPRIIRTRPPYEIRRVGWGYFTIVAYIMLKPGYSWVSSDAEDSPDGAEKGMLGLEWTLDFTRFGGRGSMGRCKLKVRNQRDWSGVDEDEEMEEGRVWQRLVSQYHRDGRYVPDDEG